jgi:hypothetical protein
MKAGGGGEEVPHGFSFPAARNKAVEVTAVHVLMDRISDLAFGGKA